MSDFDRIVPGGPLFAEVRDPPLPSIEELVREGRNLICLRTFSKAYGLAALRIGYGCATEELAGLVDRVRQPFNVNAVAQAAATAALDDQGFRARCIEGNRTGMRRLEKGFTDLGLEWVPSQANFILVRVGDGAKAFDALQRRGVIVRPVSNYGLPEWLRVTVGTPGQNERLLSELAAVLR